MKTETIESLKVDSKTGELVFSIWECQNETNDDRMLVYAEYRSPPGLVVLEEHKQIVRDEFNLAIERIEATIH